MFEHVGYANHERYFTTMNRLLKPDGLYLHHAITRTAKRNDRDFFNKNSRRSPRHRALHLSRAASSIISA